MRTDLEYYVARARQETDAADASTVVEAVFVHRQLAARYTARARQLGAGTVPANSNDGADLRATNTITKETANG